MRHDILAKEMRPVNANDAWWEGFKAYHEDKMENPNLISTPKGEDVPAYWYWDAGWWFASLNVTIDEGLEPTTKRIKKRTAKTADQVRAWIESTEHHIAESIYDVEVTKATHLLLKGYHEQLRIPSAVLKECHLTSSDKFDNRMYRWDFEKEKQILFGEYVEPRKVRVQVNGYVIRYEHHTMCYDKNGVYRGQMQESVDGPGEIFIECLMRDGKPAVATQDGWEHVPNLTESEMREANKLR